MSIYPSPSAPPPTSRPLPPRPTAARSPAALHRGQRVPIWAPLLGMGTAALIGVVLMTGLIGMLYLSVERIRDGVSAAGVDLSGRTAEAAAQTLAQQYTPPPFTVRDGDREWVVSAAQLGVSLDIEATVSAALAASARVALPPVYAVDLAQTQNGLIALSDQTNIEPQPNQNGRALDIPVLLDRLRADASAELADGIIALPMLILEPPPPQFSASVNVSETARTVHVVERGQELGLIARQYGVSVADILAINSIPNPNLIYVGQELLIPAAGVYVPNAAQAPPAPSVSGKAIVVSTSEQRIYAYENGQLVRSHLVSTGTNATPTVLGDYRIYVKYRTDDMSGADYFLPDVPYTMYFYRGYAIHGTYWHNAFGRPMSRGCVNLPVAEAEWFFNWAEVNTLVRVI